MEALLEHKMKTGRIDSHSEIGFNLNYKPSVDPFHPSAKAEGETASPPPRKGPRTPSGSPPSPPVPKKIKKGPATPTDSPPVGSSSDSRSPSFRGRSDESGSVSEFVEKVESKPEASPEKPNKSKSSQPQENREVLEKLARMARVNVDHLKNCLNPGVLSTLQQLDSSVLLATVSTVLSTLAQTVAKGTADAKGDGHPEVTSSSVSPKGINKRPELDREGLVTSTGLKDESVEMDLESDHENENAEMELPPKHTEVPDPAEPPESRFPPMVRLDLTGNSGFSESQLPPRELIAQPPMPPEPATVDSRPPLPPPAPVQFPPPCQPSNQTFSSTPFGESNPSNPNQVQMIQTLLTALAIPRPNVVGGTQTPSNLIGGIQQSSNLTAGMPPPSNLIHGGIQPSSNLIGGIQPSSNLTAGMPPPSHLIGGIPPPNNLMAGIPPPNNLMTGIPPPNYDLMGGAGPSNNRLGGMLPPSSLVEAMPPAASRSMDKFQPSSNPIPTILREPFRPQSSVDAVISQIRPEIRSPAPEVQHRMSAPRMESPMHFLNRDPHFLDDRRMQETGFFDRDELNRPRFPGGTPQGFDPGFDMLRFLPDFNEPPPPIRPSFDLRMMHPGSRFGPDPGLFSLPRFQPPRHQLDDMRFRFERRGKSSRNHLLDPSSVSLCFRMVIKDESLPYGRNRLLCYGRLTLCSRKPVFFHV